VTKGEANPRFIVTSLDAMQGTAAFLYEDIYCARGDMENRIKECQLDLYADRTPATTMRANQLRLWLASYAYVLMCALRRIALTGTELAKATCGSIRLKLLKIGAQVTVSVRRVKFALASAHPFGTSSPPPAPGCDKPRPETARSARPATQQLKCRADPPAIAAAATHARQDMLAHQPARSSAPIPCEKAGLGIFRV
jgi:hypothetical protein